MPPSIQVSPDLTDLIKQAHDRVVTLLQAAIARQGRATIALSGGSTPRPLYEKLATADLDWSKIHVFWGDERYVPLDHPDSNYQMAKLAWFDRVNFPAANIHAMPTLAGDPSADADRHNKELCEFFNLAAGEFPVFDVMLLGMGDDGHTASLFPGTDALKVVDRIVTLGNKDGQPRLTLTVPAINASANVLFLVAGANKQTALHHIFAAECDASLYPSRLIAPIGNLVWLLDQAAAEGIQS
jgi:6-phosphogluconolactonase